MAKDHHLASTSESHSSLTITVKKPSLKYLDIAIKLKCFPDLLALDLFPNAKEVTESLAAFAAVRQYLGAKSFGDSSILLVDVGCGARPRTAAAFAYLTNWSCIGVDPILRKPLRWEHRVNRLSGLRSRIEYANIKHSGLVVATCVHSHAPLDAVLKGIKAPRIVIVAIPCCIPLELDEPPKVEYADWGIFSPHRVIKIFEKGAK